MGAVPCPFNKQTIQLQVWRNTLYTKCPCLRRAATMGIRACEEQNKEELSDSGSLEQRRGKRERDSDFVGVNLPTSWSHSLSWSVSPLGQGKSLLGGKNDTAQEERHTTSHFANSSLIHSSHQVQRVEFISVHRTISSLMHPSSAHILSIYSFCLPILSSLHP